jgi:hypothetical protein
LRNTRQVESNTEEDNISKNERKKTDKNKAADDKGEINKKRKPIYGVDFDPQNIELMDLDDSDDET